MNRWGRMATVVALVTAPLVGSASATATTLPHACPVGSTVVVIGDSITEQSAPQLRVALTDAGYRPIINARGGRTIGQGAEVAWGAGEESSQYGLRCWVIALGTNNLYDANTNTYNDWIDVLTVIGFIPCLPFGCEPTWWMPVRATGGAAINAVIPSTTTQVPGWNPQAADLLPDGVHLTLTGIEHWVAAVLAAVTAEAP